MQDRALSRRTFVAGASVAACTVALAGSAIANAAEAPQSGAGDAPAGSEGAEGASAGGPGGGAGGGMQSEPIDLNGMLALSQYVFVASEGEISSGSVSAACYGAYAPGDGVAFVPEAFEGALEVFTDAEITQAAEGVTAEVAGGTLTVSGVAEEGNVAYYLSTGEGAYATTIYVVNSEYEDDATLSLADGTQVALTTFAPNMANGDYEATVEAANASGSVYIGGNRTIRTAADYGIEGDDAAAVDWFLSSGITNSGATLAEFGDVMYGFEYIMAIYRMFQIVCDQVTFLKGFTDATDYAAAMFSNDPYSDAVGATMQVGVWNGIYTKRSDVLDSGVDADHAGFYLLTNIDADTTMLGTGAAVTGKFARVGLFNAFQSRWTMKNDEGEEVAASLLEAAAAYDGATVEEPDDYTNEAKVAAVASVLEGATDDGAAAVAAMEDELDKLSIVKLLYAASSCVKSKTPPDSAWADTIGSANADISQFFGPDYGSTTIMSGEAGEVPDSLVSERNAALLVDQIAGTLTIENNTVSLQGNADDAANAIMALTDPNTIRDGSEAGTEGDGFVYNASERNAFYRNATGSAMAVWGPDSIVEMRSDDGSLVIDGEADGSAYPAGTMAGTVYVGFGGAANVANAVAYSSSQHLTNILYNGSMHYLDSAAFGSGRVYSSDFWGGYQVFEDSVATGDSVTDEPTTLIVKNCVYGKSLGGNGFASQYFENSLITAGAAAFQNTTSLATDVGALTLVNSSVTCSGDAFTTSTKGARAIVTLVDSSVEMTAASALATVDNHETVNNISMGSVAEGNEAAFQARYDGEMQIRLYGDNVITTPDGSLSATVADGASLTVFGSVVDESGAAVELAGVEMVAGDEYGTLKVVKA